MAAKQDKIVTNTNCKVIICINEIGRVLTTDEVKLFHELVEKLKRG